MFNYNIPFLQSINNNKYLAGILMIILNVLSKYITVKFTKVQEAYIKNLLGRQLLIFTIAFIATRDIIVSIILTLLFIVSLDYLLNEESCYCIIPKNIQNKMRFIEDSLFLNDDEKYPSDEEIEKANLILEKAKKINYKKDKEKNKYIYSMMYNSV